MSAETHGKEARTVLPQYVSINDKWMHLQSTHSQPILDVHSSKVGISNLKAVTQKEVLQILTLRGKSTLKPGHIKIVNKKY